MHRAHQQADFRVRFDWGIHAADAIAGGADLAVVVDVLSFTTTLTVALDLGVDVLPYRWHDESAPDFARARDATLAVGRAGARPGDISLSPASLRVLDALPARIVLPSPNGSAVAYHLAQRGGVCVGASLRNATAVGAWIGARAPRVVAVIAAGERWPGGRLRPAIEDAWGAGAVIAALVRFGWDGLSPEAHFAAAAYEDVRGREAAALLDSASGRELAGDGYRNDVEIAAEADASQVVPLLRGERFVAVT